MKQLTTITLAFGLLFSTLSTAASGDKMRCDSNVKLIKELQDNGVIQDRKYLTLGELLTATAKKASLAKKRRELGVNQDMFKNLISTIEKAQAEGRDNDCINYSGTLLKNLEKYANFAGNSKDGLAKFVSDWRKRAYFIFEPDTEGPPSDLPPQLPKI